MTAPAVTSPRRSIGKLLLAAVLLVILAHLADRWAFHALAAPKFGNTDLGRLLRIQGFLPTWIFLGGALVLFDWPARVTLGWKGAWRRGLLLVGSATAGGALAEVLKILVRRERPRAADGAYLFRAWADRPFSTSGLGMPSSHVLVATAALALLARMFPRTAPVCYTLAIGCAYGRVAAGAHFLSDVTAALLLGIVVAELLWRRFAPPTP